MVKKYYILLGILLFVASWKSVKCQEGEEEAAVDGDENVEEGEAEEEEAGEDGEPIEDEPQVLSCFSCENTEYCGEIQDLDNGTNIECAAGEHCWTWVVKEGNATEEYRRGCGDECTDTTRELDCAKTDEREECKKCCSEANCNFELISSAKSLKPFHFFVTICIPVVYYTFI